MSSVLRFPLERRRTLRPAEGSPESLGQVLILPVIRIERHDLPPPPVLTVDPPRRGGDGSRRRRRSA